MVIKLNTPILKPLVDITPGARVEISGKIFTARDAVMAKLAKLLESGSAAKLPVDLSGCAIMHTAVSPAGFGPTSSNKQEIESNIGLLSHAGVKLHLGKGALSVQTINELGLYNSVFVVVPPFSALLQSCLISSKVVAYPEEGMEAMHELEVKSLPGIIAAINGKSIFSKSSEQVGN